MIFQKYFDEKTEKYYIPESIIEQVIKKFFNISVIDHSKMPNYSSAQNEYIVDNIQGFGGVCLHTKVKSKESLPDNVIKLTVGFYKDYDYKECLYTRIYTVQDNGDSFKYLSIQKVKQEQENDSITLSIQYKPI